jgi:hypothetical protein
MPNKIKSQALKRVSLIGCKYKTIIILPIIDIPKPKNLWKAFIVNKFLLMAGLFIYERVNIPSTICVIINKTKIHENTNYVIYTPFLEIIVA